MTPVVASVAAGCALLARGARPLTGVPLPTRCMTLRADAAVAGAGPNGRAITGYPAPDGEAPVSIHLDPASGPVLADGIDFLTYDGYVWFDEDPLTRADVPAHLGWVAGVPVRSADLLYHPAAEVPDQSTDQVPSDGGLRRTIAAACGASVTGDRSETVEDVAVGADGVTVVVTDVSAYRLNTGELAVCEVGDVLPPRSPPGDAWALTRLGPETPDLTHLTTPAWFHQGTTSGPVTWYNETVPLSVDVVDSRTRVRWRLGASTDDFDDFWTASHARGTAAGAKSLARAMDTRTAAADDPGPESLPTTVNPLGFICRELFGGNAYLLIVRPDSFGPSAVTAAERASAVRSALRTATAVFEYEDEMPAVDPIDPS